MQVEFNYNEIFHTDTKILDYSDLGSHAHICIYLEAFKFLLQHDAINGRVRIGANKAPDVGIKQNHRIVWALIAPDGGTELAVMEHVSS